MARETGYYWVHFLGAWQVLRFGYGYNGNLGFNIPGENIMIFDSDPHIKEVNETRILNPDETTLYLKEIASLKKVVITKGCAIGKTEAEIHLDKRAFDLNYGVHLEKPPLDQSYNE